MASIPNSLRKLGRPRCRRQSGAMILTAAFWLVPLIGLMALAFDVGHFLLVRAELQNAADAAALAGANCLNREPGTIDGECKSTFSPTLHWDIAEKKALNTIKLNKSDNVLLQGGTVRSGYKNLQDRSDLQPWSTYTTSPIGTYYMPALEVTVSRTNGNMPLASLVIQMFGGNGLTITAKAVAAVTAPGMVPKGTLIPIAINDCMYRKYLNDSAMNTTVEIGTPKVYAGCASGQWTSFTSAKSSADIIRDLINSGNPTSLSAGDKVWITPGIQASNYKDMRDHFQITPAHGADVNVVVIGDGTDLNNAGQTIIIGFAKFHIDSIQTSSSNKNISGHFIFGTNTNGSDTVGPNFGSYIPARIAQ